MLHGNKKGRSNSKKKGPSAKTTYSNRDQRIPVSSNENSAAQDFPMKDYFAGFCSPQEATKPIQGEFKTVYRRYKEATQRFKEAIRRKVPNEVFANDSASELMDAVEYLAKTDIAIEKEILADLKTAILVRKRAAGYYKELEINNDSHEHFIVVLQYCWGALKKSAVVSRSRREGIPETEQNDDATNVSNRFEKLSVADEEVEDSEYQSSSEAGEEDELLLGEAPSVRPSLSKRLSLEELIHGHERIDIVLFVMSLDEYMRLISVRFVNLKAALGEGKTSGDPPDSIVRRLMGTAMACNLTIQLVASLEQQLITDHPHLNTIYRALAVMVFPSKAQLLASIVEQESSRASEFTENVAYGFIGDAMECSFRHPLDPENKGNQALIKDFAREWQIPESKAIEFVDILRRNIMYETPVGNEPTVNKQLFAKLDSISGENKSHSWFRCFEFIGRNRSIISTIRLLQITGCSIDAIKHSDAMLDVKKGLFGQQWDEDRKKATRIQGDLDDFLMGDVLPFLILMCSHGLLASDNLPYEKELLTFFSELKAFAKHPLRAISWTLAFAVHTMLTSVIDVQGSNDIQELGTMAKRCFQKFMIQFDLVQNSKSASARPTTWEERMHSIGLLRWFVQPPWVPDEMPREESDLKIMHAVWNPFCSGSFLLYLSYFVNLKGGLEQVDNSAQLRMVLHLFNAFVQHGALVEGDVELLDWLHGFFKTSKAVWPGGVPQKGDFVYAWWFSHGAKSDAARKRSAHTKEEVYNPDTPAMKENMNIKRTMTPIEAKDLSKSFRCICLHDFSGAMKDSIHTIEVKRKMRHTDLYQHCIRVNNTVEAMISDECLLATNWISISEMLNQFIVELFRELEVESLVQRTMTRTSNSVRNRPTKCEQTDHMLERQAQIWLFAGWILGPLDFHPDPFTHSFLKKTLVFTKLYFSKIPPSRIIYFTPIVEEDN